MISITKTSSDYDIIESGSAITYDRQSDLTFHVKTDDSFEFNVKIQFEDDDTDSQDIKSDIDGNLITITCINFKRSMGTGVTEPIELAVYQDKKIYIAFWVYALSDDSSKKISYTFYKEK